MKSILLLLVTFMSLTSFGQNSYKHFNVKFVSYEDINENPSTIGKWHNEALDYAYNALSKDVTLDRTSFTTKFSNSIVDYFKQKGIIVQLSFDGNFEDFSKESIEEDICKNISSLSKEAQNIICSAQVNLTSFIDEQISFEEYKLQNERLQLQSEKLDKEVERKICGIAVSVSQNSIEYWDKNYTKFISTFSSLFQVKSEQKGGPYLSENEINPIIPALKLRWGLIGLSDLAGAVRWGIVGFTAAGGPAGAVACGIAGAAGHSCASIIGQAIINR
ncbi:MAG: hypothetical protein JSR00_01760 [Bacteroidetes bacterium]|nr:hypothetical protein [Bacteroidota bacterium]